MFKCHNLQGITGQHFMCQLGKKRKSCQVNINCMINLRLRFLKADQIETMIYGNRKIEEVRFRK